MWMAYCTDIEVTDLESGVKYLRQQFERLEFDASHEAVYCMYGGPDYEKECNELAKQYDDGRKLCDLYLDDDICLECLVEGLQEINLHTFLYGIRQYLPDYLLISLDFMESDEETETDTEINPM